MDITCLFCIMMCAFVGKSNARAKQEIVRSNTRKSHRSKSFVQTRPSVVSPIGSYSQRRIENTKNCETIPVGFGLCHGLEYPRMRMPNLLGHLTMPEIIEQASSWPPLVSNGCHPATRIFLCSLYAPVCMEDYERSIQPCRSLCESVRNACAPAMAQFGYPWPEIFNCTKFPVLGGQEVCVQVNNVNSASKEKMKTCLPCKQKKSASLFKRKYCTFDFVMRIKIKRVSSDKGGTRIYINRKSRRTFRWPTEPVKKNSLWMHDGLHCTCSVIKNNRSAYLVTGRREGRDLVVTTIRKWNRKSRRDLKRAKRIKCITKMH